MLCGLPQPEGWPEAVVFDLDGTIADTATDMIANLSPDYAPKWGRGGFDMQTEAALLAKWHAEKG